jgi:hypothetical protein
MNQSLYSLMLFTQDFQENQILSLSNSISCSTCNEAEYFVPFVFIFWFYSLIGFITIVIWKYMNDIENISYSSYEILDEMKEFLDRLSLLSEEEKVEFEKRYYLEANLLTNQFRIQVYENLLEKIK